MKTHKQRAQNENNEKELKAGNQTENKEKIKYQEINLKTRRKSRCQDIKPKNKEEIKMQAKQHSCAYLACEVGRRSGSQALPDIGQQSSPPEIL